MTTAGAQWSDDQIDEMLRRMGEGETLTSISSDARMPSMASMMRWEDEQDTELGARITQARARGWTARAEKAVVAAQTVEDPAKGRLAFDAERWFLGKMHPKKFGDATTLKHADADGEKLPIDDVSRATRLAAIFADIEKRRTDAGTD